MGRRRMAAAVIAAVTATAAVGFAAGSRIASPAEVASRTAPPEPSVILAPVEERVLASSVVSRGTGRFGAPQKLTLASSALKPGAGIVASVPAPGSALTEGDVVATASGRPVFLLVGAAPMGRDLGPGSVGDDVAQLEASLARLGFDPGAVDGSYDDQTAAAVSAWYAAKGFAPFGATAEQSAAVRAREAETATAAVDALAAADGANSAAAALAAAQAALAAAAVRADAAGRAASLAADEAALTSAAAEAEIAVKQRGLEALLAGGQATPAEVAAAQAEVRLAQIHRDSVVLSGRRTQDDAAVARSEAANDAAAKQAAVTAAERAVATASSLLAVRSAAAEVAGSERRLARVRAGVQVPADEVIFVAAAPVRVAEPMVGIGDVALGGVAKVTDASVHIEAGLAVEDANLVKAGMPVRVEEPALGIAVDGTVRLVAAGPGTNGVDGFHVYVEVAVETPPPSLVGASVRLTIPVRSSGAPVLTVPVSAVTLAADGSSRVQRAVGAASAGGPGAGASAAGAGSKPATEFVSVEPGLAADGFVAVKATHGTLRPGDRVVIGVAPRG